MVRAFLIACIATVLVLTGCTNTATREPSPQPSPSWEGALSETPPQTPTISATPQAEASQEEEMEGEGNADVEHVRAVQAADGTWTFHVTVRHPDTGWDDYADGWDVVAPDGTVLKADPDDPFTRELLHPHENEQPFTRSQSGIEIPDGVQQVRVRAHDLVDGYGGQMVTVDLTVSSGPGFKIERRTE